MKIVLSVLTLLCIALAIYPIRLSMLEHEQAGEIQRRWDKCEKVRLGLEMARSSLWNPAIDSQEFGQTSYRMSTRGDWVEVNMCTPESIHVGDRCTVGDLPCQLNALDWALVNVR